MTDTEQNIESTPTPEMACEASEPTTDVVAETTSVETTSVETEPVEDVPAETAPVEDVPVETAPVEEVPAEEVPAETVPVETAPVEDVPVETAPVETAPVEDAPSEDVPSEDVPVEDATEIPTGEEPRTQEGMNWFVLRVASNKEDFVRNALEKKVQIEGVQHLVGRIMVPTEKTKTLTKTGKTKITETKLYPGYIFVEMKLVDARISQDVFFLIKETTGVGDFVGTAGKPTPMSNDEVDKMLFDSQAPEEVAEVKLEFAKGDHVNVKEGPFMGYEGTVDDIFPEKGVVRVLATVFGRQTQIDIEYWMIEKAE